MAIYSIRKSPMEGERHHYGTLRLWRVDETKWEQTWDQLVERWHYLASAAMVGSLVKYFIILDTWVVGAISFCAAAYKLGQETSISAGTARSARNTWHGW